MHKVDLISSYIPKKFLNRKHGSLVLTCSGSETSGIRFLRADTSEYRRRTQLLLDDATSCHPRIELSSEIQPGIDTSNTYIEMKAGRKPHHSVPKIIPLELQTLMSKSVIGPGFEKQYSVPEYSEGLRQRRRERLAEKANTRGPDWFDMPAKELTEDLKNDLEIIQMRRALDRKRFYKKSDPLPKYFQVGTVLDNPADYYHSRVPKKDRKRTLVEELLADAEFRKYGKKKYTEVLAKHPKWKNRYRKRKE